MKYLLFIFVFLLNGCADHYWKGRAYEEKVKALYYSAEGKKIPMCSKTKNQQECIVDK